MTDTASTPTAPVGATEILLGLNTFGDAGVDASAPEAAVTTSAPCLTSLFAASPIRPPVPVRPWSQ